MGPAPIKNLQYRVITDPNSAILSLEAGDIDTYILVQQSSVKRIEENEKLEMLQGPTFGLSFIQVNTEKPPFDNVKARQALCYAIDKEAMLDGILDGNGMIMDTFVTENYLGYIVSRRSSARVSGSPLSCITEKSSVRTMCGTCPTTWQRFSESKKSNDLNQRRKINVKRFLPKNS